MDTDGRHTHHTHPRKPTKHHHDTRTPAHMGSIKDAQGYSCILTVHFLNVCPSAVRLAVRLAGHPKHTHTHTHTLACTHCAHRTSNDRRTHTCKPAHLPSCAASFVCSQLLLSFSFEQKPFSRSHFFFGGKNLFVCRLLTLVFRFGGLFLFTLSTRLAGIRTKTFFAFSFLL
jgi:hypothetical protein